MNTDNWRDDAINEALRAESEYGESYDALLRQIRLHDANLATMTIWPDRRALKRFLQAQACDVRSLLRGENRYDGDERDNHFWPYVAWLSCRWRECEIEIALAPSEYVCGKIICFAADASVLEAFTRELTAYADKPLGRSLRYSQGWQNAPELDSEIGRTTWDDLILAPQILDEVRGSVENFFAHRDSFAALGFAWRRGLLLVGPPGTGKTMICKAAASALPDLPFLYVRDLRDDDKKESVKSIFKRARKLAPCLLVFEDLDGLVGEAWRSVFLNEMDGFASNEGIFVIASSNHPGKIDAALLKRPSRFDRVVQIGLPASAERSRYCAQVLNKLASRLAPDFDVRKVSERVAQASKGFTPAYLKEAITSAALQMAQDGVAVLDARFADAIEAQVVELRAHLKRMKDPDALAEMRSGEEAVGFRR